MPKKIPSTDFFVVNSIASATQLKEKINNGDQIEKIQLSGNHDVLHTFFQDINFILKELTIQTEHFDERYYQNALIKIIKNGLVKLVIDVNYIELPKTLINYFYFYSSLEHLEVFFQQCAENTCSAKKTLEEFKLEIHAQCAEIIRLNEETNRFLTIKLPEYTSQIEKLAITKDNIEKLDAEQIKFVITLVDQADYFNQLNKFHKDLYKERTFELIRLLTSAWDINILVINDNNLEKLKKLIPLLPNFNLNDLLPSFPRPERLIDKASQHQDQAKQIIKYLIESGADLICIEKIDFLHSKLDQYFRVYEHLVSFPFGRLTRHHDKDLRALILNDEAVFYDGLAWLIYGGESYDFKMFTEEKQVDFNHSIPKGAFAEFTLFQLMLYYTQITLYMEWLTRLYPDEIISLSNQIYPSKTSFIYSGWSILSVVIYKGEYDTLTMLLPKSIDSDFRKINLTNNESDHPIILLLYGAMNLNSLAPNKKQSRLIDYKKCFNYLCSLSFLNVDLKNLRLTDSAGKNTLPLLHFSIFHKIIFVIQDHILSLQGQLQEKAFFEINNIEETIIGGMTPLELVTVLKEKEEAITTLFPDHVSKILPVEKISRPLSFLHDLNLFQYSILSKNFHLFTYFIKWKACPVNMPFPKNLSEYPGWLPIHVILLNAFTEGTNFLIQLLTRDDINLTVPFPEAGKPHHLTNYYPISAIFYSAHPLKNPSSDYQELSNCIDFFNPSISRINGKKLKRMILDQALYLALVHHKSRGYDNNDHSDAIPKIVALGANPYQSYGTEGNLLIDLAKEKGLLHLFPNYLEQRLSSLTQQITLISGNRRESEFQRFSNRRLEINEDYYSVVSLVRNRKSNNYEHVFIVVEKIVKGRYEVHFVDFVKNSQRPGKGKVRSKWYIGKLTEILLLRCELPLMQIINIDDLSSSSWQITNEACEKLLLSIQQDENKSINYVSVGDKSMFARSSQKQGHNCYTWARKQLLTTEDHFIEKDVKPSLEEWIATLPSLKMWKYRYTLFGAGGALLIAAASISGSYIHNWYTTNSL